MISKKYLKSLDLLRQDIMEMSKISQRSLHEAILALKKRDTEAKEVFHLEKIADNIYLKIEERSIQMVALYQPVASDLRFLTSSMTVGACLERIADYSIDIAKIIQYVENEKENIETVFEMSKIAEKMIIDSTFAFINKNEKKVESVLENEEAIDKLYGSMFSELYKFISNAILNGEKNKRESAYIVAINFLLIARYLERIGDHSVNIANKTMYAIKGEKEYL
ncbi:MAG: phosphate signaling complex protein PhoU [Candidatus Altiarchaeota archaeon]